MLRLENRASPMANVLGGIPLKILLLQVVKMGPA